LPGTDRKDRKKEWTGLKRYNNRLISTYNLDINVESKNNTIIIMNIKLKDILRSTG